MRGKGDEVRLQSVRYSVTGWSTALVLWSLFQTSARAPVFSDTIRTKRQRFFTGGNISRGLDGHLTHHPDQKPSPRGPSAPRYTFFRTVTKDGAFPHSGGGGVASAQVRTFTNLVVTRGGSDARSSHPRFSWQKKSWGAKCHIHAENRDPDEQPKAILLCTDICMYECAPQAGRPLLVILNTYQRTPPTNTYQSSAVSNPFIGGNRTDRTGVFSLGTGIGLIRGQI